MLRPVLFSLNIAGRRQNTKLCGPYKLHSKNHKEILTMYAFIKRVFDIILSFFLILIGLITFPFVALGIRLSSPGPILYVSKRIGKDGKAFDFYKYRSMHLDDGTSTGIVAEQKRIFKFGQMLRRTKIDELPQALNVMKGDLSIVGPRPMLTTNAAKMYSGRYSPVMTVKPGLTSYASLFDYTHGDALIEDRQRYKSEIVPIKQELELYYVQNKGFLTDIQIILKTAIVIFSILGGKKDFHFPKEYYIVKEHLDNMQNSPNLCGKLP